jgi:hypothetical protein
MRLKNNYISIIILIYFLANTFYITFSPDLPDNSGLTFWDIYWFGVMYGLIVSLGICLFELAWEVIDKYFSIALSIYSFSFFCFYVFHLGSTMKEYLIDCNSHEIGLIFTAIVFTLIVLILIVHYIFKL